MESLTMYYSSPTAVVRYAAFLSDLPSLTFDAKNPHFKNSYLSLNGLLDAITPVLKEHNGYLTTGLSAAHSGEFNTIEVEFVFLTEDKSDVAGQVRSTMYVPVLDNPQHFGSYLTYARRYAILTALGVAPDADDDAESSVTATSFTNKTTRQGGLPRGRR
ncbi:DNA repair protein RAD52-like protein [Arthronema virus TR020]|uniref:DNA repair protein RAD52-like protein n=1 Tax=Arthronema virus TR020 TaxID=2736280 RepID=A0A7G3WH40_9CAUD|nr:DNA repair protein RAD52-like protein [Arthronema virus TR020]